MGSTTTTDAPAEPIEVDVVDDDAAGGDVEAVKAELVREESPSARAANEAIVAASDAALTMPGIPGRDEFLSLAMQARILSMSGAAPKLVRNNPHLAFHVAMVGRDLGISPSAALELIDVIDGRNGPQLSLSPQLLNGQIRRLGLGSIVPVVHSAQRCIAVALGPDGFYDPRCKPQYPDHHELCECTIRSFLGESEFTWDDARTAGLVQRECEPGNHRCLTRDRKCNQGYIAYPKRMLWWRAAGFLADDIFPEASLGLYSPEALGAIVDEEGRPVDPASVELPPGYESHALPSGRPAPAPTAEPGADPTAIEELAIRIEALPEEQRAVLREKWGESTRLRGHKLADLPANALNMATSMVKGFEVIAARAGWDAEAARAEVLQRRAQTAQDASSGDAEPETSTEADESPGEPSDAQSDADESPGELDEPEGERPAPDAAIAEWVRGIAEAAPADVRDSTVAEVKALHHATVNRELVERGWDPEGQHIDTRRMVLTAARLEEQMHPDRCIIVRCEDPRAETDGLPVAYCTGHTPF